MSLPTEATRPDASRSGTLAPGSGAALAPATSTVALPRGSRDLLPAACRLRRRVTQTLLGTFEGWGYEPVATPAIEYFDVLARGLSEADRRGCVRFIAAGSGELVSLRADVTPQVARMVAQRWGGEFEPDVVHRFSYAADVLRQPTSAREQAEVHQVGVELLGDDDPAADAELVALAEASLRAVGLETFALDVAHTALARELLDKVDGSPTVREQLRALLARKDRDGLVTALARTATPQAVAQAVVALCDLYGPPTQVLPRAREVLAGLGVEAALDQLAAVLDQLAQMDAAVLSKVTVDLGEARGYDYYSGMRVRGWAPGVPYPVVRGGRYDGLPRRYGVPRPATGFAIDLEALERALAEQGSDAGSTASTPAHLVAVGITGAAARAAAHAAAGRARAQGSRAWVQPGVTRARAQQLAEAAGARGLTFVDERGATVWAQGPDGWARKKEGS